MHDKYWRSVEGIESKLCPLVLEVEGGVFHDELDDGGG